MSTNIKYKNDEGDFITTQQQVNLDEYSKLTYSSGNLKLIEQYSTGINSSYKNIQYFLDDSEDTNSILQEFADLNRTLHFNKQIQGNYTLWDWETYLKNGSLAFKGQVVFDNQNRTLFVCTFDLQTNALQAGAEKYFFGNQFENEYTDTLLQFIYNSDGTINSIIDVNENFGYNDSISLDTFLADTQFSQQEFPWDQHTYYHAVTPYLPTGDL